MIVSSVTARIAQPMIGAYSSSKAAVTAMGLSLRMEMHAHGIGVTILEPGAIATNIWETGEQQSAEFTDDHPAMQDYRVALEGLRTLGRRLAANAMPADRGQDSRSLAAEYACPSARPHWVGCQDSDALAGHAPTFLVRGPHQAGLRNSKTAFDVPRPTKQAGIRIIPPRVTITPPCSVSASTSSGL